MWRKNGVFRNIDVQEYNTELRQICERENIKFIEIIHLLNNEDLDNIDGVHSNSKVHSKLFEYIKESLLCND